MEHFFVLQRTVSVKCKEVQVVQMRVIRFWLGQESA